MRDRFTRRTFLGFAGTSLAAFLIPACRDGERLDVDGEELDVSTLDPTDWVVVQRARDLVNVRLGLVNLARSADGTQLVRTGTPALLLADFGPQVLGEQVFAENATAPPPAPPPVGANLAQPSRVVFYVPTGTDTLPLHTETLLAALQDLGMNVEANAAPLDGLPVPVTGGGTTSGTRGAPIAPDELETAIELPWRLQISPNAYARWLHAKAAASSPRGRVELWHTRLAGLNHAGVVDERDRLMRTARAIWHRKPNPETEPWPGALTDGATLSSNDREQLSRLTTQQFENIPPAVMLVDRLMLSALGGWLDATTEFKPGTGLVRWVHRTVMGRDLYVEVVYRGFAFPFGHAVSLVKVSERKQAGPTDPAYLRQRKFLVVNEKTRTYPLRTGADAAATRMMPWQSVTFLDEASPPLDTLDETNPFIPRIGGVPLRMKVEAIDRGGNRHAFAPTLVWVPEAQLHPSYAVSHEALYQQSQPRTDASGRRLWVASDEGATPGSTTFEARAVTPGGVGLDTAAWSLDPSHPGWHPVLASAELAVDAMRVLAGADDAKEFRYHADYIASGFTSNPRHLFMELADLTAPLSARFTDKADHSGGFVAPNLDVRGLSRLTGVVTDVLNNTATLDPTQLFPVVGDPLALLNAKLFGCISLADVLERNLDFSAMAPKLVTDALDEVQRYRKILDDLPGQANALATQLAAVTEVDLSGYLSDLASLADRATTLAGTIASKTLDPNADAGALQLEVHGWFADLTAPVESLRTTLVGNKSLAFAYTLPDGNELERGVRALLSVLDRIHDVAADIENALVAYLRALELVKQQQVTLTWSPTLRDFGPFQLDPGGGLHLTAVLRGKAQGDSPAGADVLCSLERFKLVLVPGTPAITLRFDKLQFRRKMGKKPEIDAVFKGIEFGGPLSFIQTIKDALPLDGFSDPPGVEITPQGLVASYSFGLPNVAVGMFSLENIAIHSRLDVPFLGDAMALHFGFASREKPFLLTVMGLGGSGYVGLTVTPAGITAIEAQLEFGAHVSIDLGVASGAVSVMAGIYFGMATAGPKQVTLTGYLRIRGEVDVLGIVSASIELRMELEYRSNGGAGKVVGRATLEIEVSVAFFSTSVHLECERKFAGANGDPTFAQIMGPYGSCRDAGPVFCDPDDPANFDTFPWLDYCGAFA